jgi:sterol desaturase/sphingolipid hydroxylase (fatty acid hydroxylase superfamily)
MRAEELDVLLNHRKEVLLVSLALGVMEIAYAAWRRQHVPSLGETTSNLVIHVGTDLLRRVTYAPRFALFALCRELSPLRVPVSLGWAAACFVLVDLLYYWKHRALHEFGPFWAFHSVHHTSRELNLSTSVRSSWVQRTLEDSVFYFLLALLGFDPALIILVADLNLYSQFWCHTRFIGKLGALEGIINTPSAHRVHHGESAEHSGKNYGSFFMIWDRLWGTYQPEPEGLVVGSPGEPVGTHPLRIQFDGVIRLWRGERVAQ